MESGLTRFARLSQRLFNVPLMVHPAKAEMVVAALADRLGLLRLEGIGRGGVFAMEDADEVALYGPSSPRASSNRPYDVIEGVAVIEISGLLVQKSGSLRPYCGMTGYDGLRVTLLTAIEDDDVKAIWLNIDSGGGEVSGLFDLVDTIVAMRGEKPIWAMLDEHGYSAAYAIASAADRIILPRTGGAGSIGVVTMHVDFSQALKTGGVAVTMIHYGDRKVDGNEYEPLSTEAGKRIQAEIDRVGALFVATVAKNRKLSANAVRNQQAGIFYGPDAVEAGLADAVMSPDQAFSDLLKSIG